MTDAMRNQRLRLGSRGSESERLHRPKAAGEAKRCLG